MADTKIGAVTHYFDKIKVAIIKLTSGKLAVGDSIKIVGRGNELVQKITSMQIEHEAVELVKKGNEFGLRVDQPVKEGDIVYKVAE